MGKKANGEACCGNCLFWRGVTPQEVHGEEKEIVLDDDGKTPIVGRCCRYPPKIGAAVLPPECGGAFLPARRVTQFPITDGCDWCGEWQAINLPPAK